MKTEIRMLNRYLREHGPTKLALKLGYKSTGSITQWVYRGHISKKAKKAVMKVLRESA